MENEFQSTQFNQAEQRQFLQSLIEQFTNKGLEMPDASRLAELHWIKMQGRLSAAEQADMDELQGKLK